MFTWLHITDLHANGKYSASSEWCTRRADELLEDITNTLSYHNIGALDCIFFTGDLTKSGASEEFYQEPESSTNHFRETVSFFLEELLEKIEQHQGFRPSVYVVPGNHELNFNDLASYAEFSDQYMSMLFDAVSDGNDENSNKIRTKLYSKLWDDSNLTEDARDIIKRMFENYFLWQKKYMPSTVKHGLVPGDFSHTHEVERNGSNFKVGVCGLNTAYSQLSLNYPNGEKFDEKKAKLFLNPAQITGVTGANKTDWCSKHDFNILLAHHPLSQYVWRYNDDIHQLISNRFDVLLSGHKHISSYVRSADPVTGYINYTGMSLKDKEFRFFDKPILITGYSIGVVEQHPRSGQLVSRMLPRIKMDTTPGSCFTTDPFGLTEPNGCWTKQYLLEKNHQQAEQEIFGELPGNWDGYQLKAESQENMGWIDNLSISPDSKHRIKTFVDYTKASKAGASMYGCRTVDASIYGKKGTRFGSNGLRVITIDGDSGFSTLWRKSYTQVLKRMNQKKALKNSNVKKDLLLRLSFIEDLISHIPEAGLQDDSIVPNIIALPRFSLGIAAETLLKKDEKVIGATDRIKAKISEKNIIVLPGTYLDNETLHEVMPLWIDSEPISRTGKLVDGHANLRNTLNDEGVSIPKNATLRIYKFNGIHMVVLPGYSSLDFSVVSSLIKHQFDTIPDGKHTGSWIVYCPQLENSDSHEWRSYIAKFSLYIGALFVVPKSVDGYVSTFLYYRGIDITPRDSKTIGGVVMADPHKFTGNILDISLEEVDGTGLAINESSDIRSLKSELASAYR